MASPLLHGDKLPGIILPSDKDSDDNLQVNPLMVASYYGDIEKVATLLQRDPQNIFARNSYDQTALSYALDKGHIRLLIYFWHIKQI